jgi:outer membrane beta-barrel protein
MKKTRIGLLVAAALWVVPAVAWGQKKAEPDKSGDAQAGSADQGAAGEGADQAGEGKAGEDKAGEGSDIPGGEGVPGTGEALPGGAGLGDICQIDPQACPHLDMAKEAKKPLHEQIYAMQQLYVLRARRLEINPYWSFTLNDQFVSHPAPGIALNYYITNVLAIGANFNYYAPFNNDSKFNADLRRAARVAVPLTEYSWGAAGNFTYVPAMGKFAGFGDFIFHYDAYVVGGVGALSTRPVPIIDPDNRNFSYKTKLAFNAGIGLRIFFNRWFAGVLEVRDYIFNDKLENLSIPTTVKAQQDSANWYGDSKLTNNVQAQVGISIFLPFSFEYRLPK